MPMDKWQREIHERLLIEDVTASAELVEALSEPLLYHLTKKYPKLRDPDSLYDAVTDALMSYIKRPAQFDPTKRSLIGFLGMAAEGDLLNALAKEKRRRQKGISLEDVELEIVVGNSEVEKGNSETEPERDDLRQALPRIFKDPKDLVMVELMISGERTTESFVEVLELQHLPVDQQRREVQAPQGPAQEASGTLWKSHSQSALRWRPCAAWWNAPVGMLFLSAGLWPFTRSCMAWMTNNYPNGWIAPNLA
jgi:DNA-directed RNA polymerase specialized sigma24 family protein